VTAGGAPPVRRALAGAALATLVALALPACTADSPAGPAGSPSAAPGASPSAAAGWPVELDSSAIALAATPSGLIAVTPGSSRFPPQVHRFDPTGARVARQAAVGMPNGLAIAADGAAWVPAVRHPDMQTGTGVPVFDPTSLRPRGEIDIGTDPFSVAFPPGQAWIGARGRIYVVDPVTRAPRRSLPLPGTAYQLVAAPAAGTVVVVLSDGLVALDARTGRLLARRAVASDGTIAAAVAGDALWVAWPAGGATVLRRFDPRTLRRGPAGPGFGAAGVAVAAGGRVLWVADRASGTVRCVDPASGAVRATRPLRNTGAVAADERWVYAADGVLVRRVQAGCG
jgi:DNA-binding beta-propeller fold protein YncE